MYTVDDEMIADVDVSCSVECRITRTEIRPFYIA